MTDYDLRVAGGSLVTPSGVVQQDLLVAGGLVAAIVDPGAQASAADVVNAEGLHVFSGCCRPPCTPRPEHHVPAESGGRSPRVAVWGRWRSHLAARLPDDG